MESKQGSNVENFFPIYDVIYEQVKSSGEYDKPFSTDEYITLINKLKSVSIDKNGRDMIYVLVRVHSLRNSNSKFLDIPFGGEKLNNKTDENNSTIVDIKFDIRNFPNKLNQMLYYIMDLNLIIYIYFLFLIL